MPLRRPLPLGRSCSRRNLPPRGRRFLHLPQSAVEQALAAVIAQANELVAGHWQGFGESAPFAHARVVGSPRSVAADQHLIGVDDALRIEFVARHHLCAAVVAGFELLAFAHIHRQSDDRIVTRLAMNFGQHHVGFGVGEKSAAGNRRQLRRIAQHKQRHAERFEVAAKVFVDHRAFVDHNQLCLRGRRFVPQVEARRFLAVVARHGR